MSPARLPMARREKLKSEAFRLSLEEGMSYRAIAKRLGIDPHTSSRLIKEAASEARQDIDLVYAKTLRARTKLLESLEEQLTREGVSAHGKAQIGHAINSTLDSIDLLVGTRAPTKSAVAARVTSSSSSGKTAANALDLSSLTPAELWLYDLLFKKISVSDPGYELYKDLDVIGEVVAAHRAGTLPTDVSDFFDSRSLLNNDTIEDAEIID